MRSMQTAFTMIELIFVIVILGILSAVAIPKLVATRNDAMTSKLATNIMTSAAEISSYAISHAHMEDNLTLMSDAIKMMVSTGDATLNSNEVNIKAGDVSDCVIVSVDRNNTSGVDTLNILFSSAGADNSCLSLQSAIDASRYPMKLRGKNVIY